MSDIKATTLTATGALGNSAGRTRIKAISFVPVAEAGNITITDGGASGTTLLDLDVDTGSSSYMELPGDGILSMADPYVTLTTVASVTIFYT